MSNLEILPVRPLETGKEREYHPNLPSIKRNKFIHSKLDITHIVRQPYIAGKPHMTSI